MVGPSSSHTAGAVRLGLMARNIYKNEFKKVKFVLYNSFAKTGFGHGTDKGLLAGVLGYSVDEVCIKNIFDIVIFQYSGKIFFTASVKGNFFRRQNNRQNYNCLT